MYILFTVAILAQGYLNVRPSGRIDFVAIAGGLERPQ